MSAHTQRTVPAALLLAALAILQPQSVVAADAAPTATEPAPDSVALVNGVPLTRDLLDVFSQAAMGQHAADLNDSQRGALLDALIRAEIISQQAEKLGLSPRNELDIPDATRGQIAFGRLQAMNQAAVDAFARANEPNEAELRAEYERQIALVPRTQYHAHHILVKSEAAADSVIKQIKAGATFESVAMKNSIDPSGLNGGDLGWFSLQTMTEPFAAALKAMKKGEISAHPVRTAFGWHVIRLDETRTLAVPSFESMQEKLADKARGEKVQAYIGQLLKSAEVQKFQ